MSAWIVITKAKMQDYLVDAQLQALCQSALGDGQADPFVSIMQDRTNYVRNRISKRVQISATAFAVPPELVTCAALLIMESLQVRLAPGLSLKDDQKGMIARAYKDLDIAGTNDLPVSLPDDPITPTVQQGSAGAVITKPTQTLNRESLKGL